MSARPRSLRGNGELGIQRTGRCGENRYQGKGKVSVYGGLWNAESDEPIAAGDRVIVTAVKDMTAKVEKERGGI
jgi:membrane protein implicated in regulation of membrane protease activity